MQRVIIRYLIPLLLLLGVDVSALYAQTGNVGIGTVTPNNSALLELSSTSRGLLIPRMTQTQMNAIGSPATGLLVYATDSVNASNPSTFYYYTGTKWVPFLGAGWLLLGNSGTSPTTNFIGTRDSVDWVIRTNNTPRVRVYADGHVGLLNSNNTAEELRFFEPSGSGSNYTSFRAGAQAADVTYTLPPADGSSSQVLTTDGSGNLTWRSFGFVGGGGVDTLWRRGSGTYALEGVGQSNSASGNYSMAAGLNNKASGIYAIALGFNNVASGAGSVVSGGESDTASGSHAVVSGGEGNSASGSYSVISGGSNNKACGNYAVVSGGFNNIACGDYSAIPGGTNNYVSGNYSFAFGNGANVTQNNSVVFYHATGTKVGIGTASPTEALDIVGNMKFSGALMPNNNPGTSGYVLASAGATSAPVWTSPSNLYWSTLGNTGTSPSTNYLGTSDAQALVIRTAATERLRVLSSGQVAIGTTTTIHQLHSVYSGTNDETAGIYGNASAATANQAIGVWGAATSSSISNTGTIGVLATGNGNSSAGSTNVALQINDGEFTMGRTTEAPSAGTVVENAAAGSAYSQQGPSGVIELTLGAAGNLVTSAPVAGTFQSLGTITINNRYVNASSIIVVNIESKVDDGVAPDAKLATYFADVDDRAAGSFTLRVGMIPSTTSISNYTSSDKIRVGYMVVNPGK